MLEKLFQPKNVAVIGASRSSDKLGYQILNNIVTGGFKGEIYPVNPKAQEILNYQCFAKISDIEADIDLAIIILPAPIVLEVLKECVEKNVGFVVIISAGFSEIGEKGKAHQDKIEAVIKGTKTRVLGPNCLGVINSSVALNASFAAPKIIPGFVSFVFQSGALGAAMLDWADTFEFGLSKFISLGNKVDLEESVILDYLAQDPKTKIIAVYLEAISDPAKFIEAAKKASSQKPVIILKGGQTFVGAKAAYSHTAAQMTPNRINRAIFRQANLVEANSIEEMLNLIELFSTEPPIKNKNLAIITNAGGAGILATDAAMKNNIQLPQINQKIREELKNNLPEISSIANPLDLTGIALASHYDEALKALTETFDFNILMCILTPQTSTEVEKTAQCISRYAKFDKPIIAVFLGEKTVAPGIKILRENKIPVFYDPIDAIIALKSVVKYWQKEENESPKITNQENAEPLHHKEEALDLVKSYGINTPNSGIATTVDVAMRIAGRIGYPVAVKNINKKIVHKFKAGKIVLNINDDDALKSAIVKVELPVLIQKMIEAPFEVIIGAKKDNHLGVLLNFGWGGVYTEDLDDIASRILSGLTENDLDEMIKETRIGKILIKEKVDLALLKDIVGKVAKIMTDHPEISEMDLNPIKVGLTDAICVDARYK